MHTYVKMGICGQWGKNSGHYTLAAIPQKKSTVEAFLLPPGAAFTKTKLPPPQD